MQRKRFWWQNLERTWGSIFGSGPFNNKPGSAHRQTREKIVTILLGYFTEHAKHQPFRLDVTKLLSAKAKKFSKLHECISASLGTNSKTWFSPVSITFCALTCSQEPLRRIALLTSVTLDSETYEMNTIAVLVLCQFYAKETVTLCPTFQSFQDAWCCVCHLHLKAFEKDQFSSRAHHRKARQFKSLRRMSVHLLTTPPQLRHLLQGSYQIKNLLCRKKSKLAFIRSILHA